MITVLGCSSEKPTDPCALLRTLEGKFVCRRNYSKVRQVAQNRCYGTALLRLRTCILSRSSFSVPLEVIFSCSEKEILVSKKAFVAFSNYGIIISNKQENANGCIGNR